MTAKINTKLFMRLLLQQRRYNCETLAAISNGDTDKQEKMRAKWEEAQRSIDELLKKTRK